MHRHGHIDAITHVPLADAVMAIETARTRCRYVGRSNMMITVLRPTSLPEAVTTSKLWPMAPLFR